MSRAAVGERILLTFWVGSLWTVGYAVAPMLFAKLDDRALAGFLAGELFTLVAWVGLFCGLPLVLIQWLRGQGWRNWRLWMLIAMLALVLLGELVVRPMMAQADGGAFMRLHGIAQALYLAVSLLGLALVAFGPAPDRDGL